MRRTETTERTISRSFIEKPPRLKVTVALLLFACACVAGLGCARHVPLSQLGSSGAVVWVRLTTSDDENVVGRVVSLDAGSIVVAVEHELGGDVRVRERDGVRALYSGTERVPGEFIREDREDGQRAAVVHRTFRAAAVVTATFHESSGEQSMASVISLLLGPVIGGVLGFAL